MRLLSALIILFIYASVKAQVFHYTNYNIKDGLAGSIVYSMCQDKDGFMWFGTENGLSRYDGTHFKNFTIKDGLPDNEVLKVCADSKGRVWIGTFSKEICYYYNGRIYNRDNSELLRKIKLEGNPESIFESGSQSITMSSKQTTIIITPSDSVIKYRSRDIGLTNKVWGLTFNFYGKIRLRTEDWSIYEYDENKFLWKKLYKMKIPKITGTTTGSLFLDSFEQKKISLKFSGFVYSEEFRSGQSRFLSTTEGAWLVDTIALKLGFHFLKELQISHTMEDREKNIWFASLGNGLFKLPSLNIKTLSANQEQKNGMEIYTLVKYNADVLAGSNYNRAYIIDKTKNYKELNFTSLLKTVYKFGGPGRLFSSVSISNKVCILGFDGCIAKLENNKPSFKYIGGPVKSVEKINDTAFIAGTAFYAFKIRLKDLKITDTLWRERCTKVFFNNGNYYIGTLAGLYEIKEDKSSFYLGSLHPILTRRITDIKVDASDVLWVSTSDKGVIGIKNRKIIRVIDDSSGLSGNNSKTLFTAGKYLWVGTNKGICKVNISTGNNSEVIKYSVSDGLPSNIINAIYIQDSIVWVGSPEGVTFFEEKNISALSICNLKITGVAVSGKPSAIDSGYNLSYRNNNIRFDFAGISFRSGNEITYYYKLSGIDTGWKTTTENYLDYKTLPSGNYKLNLYALNKYGVKSNSITIRLNISSPFWKTVWFYLFIIITATGGIAYLFGQKNKKNKERLEETNRIQKQFAELEQQALQSQMNPHFIFNCLNSIQQYILTGDREKANQYLTGFAYLIRQTLNISSQKTISLREEAEYLTRYLDMEQMRFGDNFIYQVKLEDIINPETVQIPSLLIQPFVENSLRHGIRNLTDRVGKIDITFSLINKIITCRITDNGIGRDKAAEYKSNQHIEYQSKGMDLTNKRINLLNSVSEKKISLTITDLKDTHDNPCGTLVELNIPL
jgi:Histidine kinase/Y_Y_Y domain/Two component regulator propeller